jgi:hypothetical protein
MTREALVDLYGSTTGFAFLIFVFGMIASMAIRDSLVRTYHEHGTPLYKHPLDRALFPFEDFIKGWREIHISGKRRMIVWSVVLALQALSLSWCALWGLLSQYIYE